MVLEQAKKLALSMSASSGEVMLVVEDDTTDYYVTSSKEYGDSDPKFIFWAVRVFRRQESGNQIIRPMSHK